ncbi:MAG: hypothetical protein QOE33_3627 [Acidobacteriota bacterium]|nr:hypothetical protein [Acidobacteriota bacterium]
MTPKTERIRLCYCSAYQCNGTPQTQKIYLAHMKLSEASSAKLITELESAIFDMTLKDGTSNPLSKQGDAIWERNSHSAVQYNGGSPTHHNPSPNIDIRQPVPAPLSGSQQGDTPTQALFKELLHLDHSMDKRHRSIFEELGKLPSSGIEDPSATFKRKEILIAFLQTEEEWFLQILGRLRTTRTLGDQPIRALRDAMVKRAEEVVKMTGEKRREFGGHSTKVTSSDIVDTSESRKI